MSNNFAVKPYNKNKHLLLMQGFHFICINLSHLQLGPYKFQNSKKSTNQVYPFSILCFRHNLRKLPCQCHPICTIAPFCS